MDEVETPAEHQSFLTSHKFLLLVVASIFISIILVVISLELYTSSGAADLDLSRPGYRSVSSQAITSDNSFQVYPSSGPVNESSIEQFENIYNKQVQQIKAIDAFGGDPLSPDALELSAPTTN
jgi:hypothetical protein